MTITAEHTIEVSRRIKEEFDNGRNTMRARKHHFVAEDRLKARAEYLTWHNETVYRGYANEESGISFDLHSEGSTKGSDPRSHLTTERRSTDNRT